MIACCNWYSMRELQLRAPLTRLPRKTWGHATNSGTLVSKHRALVPVSKSRLGDNLMPAQKNCKNKLTWKH